MASKADWDPALYKRFEDERTRPARELLARVPLERPRRVYDLGCGPGNSTELLVRRFPDAQVIGVDNSEAMLADARKRLPGVRFERADIADWRAAEPPDLIYSNATLQWLGAHATLIPRLFAQLMPGGVFALQMPDNLDEPSHRLMRETAASGPWSAALESASRTRTPILAAGAYYDLLAPGAAEIDVWRTAYQHRMAGPDKIVDWLRATGLRPFVDPLNDEQRAGFLAAYEQAIAQAYPVRADGRRLLAFPRLFVVARRAP